MATQRRTIPAVWYPCRESTRPCRWLKRFSLWYVQTKPNGWWWYEKTCGGQILHGIIVTPRCERQTHVVAHPGSGVTGFLCNTILDRLAWPAAYPRRNNHPGLLGCYWC